MTTQCIRRSLNAFSRAGVLLALAVLGHGEARAAETPAVLTGDVTIEAEARVIKSGVAVFSLADDAKAPVRFRTTVRLEAAPEATAPTALLVLGAADRASTDGEAFGRVSITRSSGEQDGRLIRFATQERHATTNKWVPKDGPRLLSFWPVDKKLVKALEADGIPTQTWHNRWIELRVDVTPEAAAVWAQGVLVAHLARSPGSASPFPILLQLSQGDAIGPVKAEPLSADSQYLPLDLRHSFNGKLDEPLQPTPSEVPFHVLAGQRGFMDLREARWADQKRDPQTFYEAYDGGPSFLGDPRMPMLSVPKGDYIAAHLLAVADKEPGTTNLITLRAGRFGYQKQVLLRDYTGEVPRGDVNSGFTHVRVPLTEVVAQDILDDVLEIEVTKELRLARHVPDPNRFRYRPLGLPSGVRIAAITLERSPLQMKVTSLEAGHAFVEPATPSFSVHLNNITAAEQPYELTVQATHLRGGSTETSRSGVVPAGQSVVVAVAVEAVRRGYHDLSVTLSRPGGEPLLRRITSFAHLAPDNRQHRDASPFGTWEWNGTHVTPTDSDAIGSLFKKLGFRYGMNSHSPQARQKWGLVSSSEPKLDPELTRFKKIAEREGVAPLRGLVFHEDSISGPHVMRVPDLFHDRPPYKLNEEEEARYATLLASALGGAKALREQYPDVKISFGNGPMPTKEEFYRRGFPSELFDHGGNEAGSFHRLPEAQPPDGIANNASLWMDRQLLDAYGYTDKTVHQCIEVGYPNDNPGNHSPETAANYFVRNALHSLAWGMTFLHNGEIPDVGNSYYFSNWGAAGFCRSFPEMNVKPSFVAVATLTAVLDGATFVRVHDTGSRSVYALEFKRPDGRSLLAFWTVRGRRPIQVERGKGTWTFVDDQGNESEAPASLIATPTPNFLVGPGKITNITLGEPEYAEAPPADATILAPLSDINDWTVQAERNVELEVYNFMEPRRKGDFRFTASAGGTPALRVTPQPIAHGKDTMPMYAKIMHKEGIPMPGTPDEIGLWINGNSGWGRVIFEMVDASGQRWISLGAAAKEEAPQWLTDWMPEEMQGEVGKTAAAISDWSTNDPYGLSRINFDGWRYVGFPLPGNHPGEGHPWPVNAYWRWDGDGVVKYPLRLTGLAFEIPEKVLYVKTWEPVPQPAIEVRDLSVGRSQTWGSERPVHTRYR